MESTQTYPGQNEAWTSDIRFELPIKVGKEAEAARKPTTFIEEWKECLPKYGKLPAIAVKRNQEWKRWTYEEYYQENIKCAKSLLALNIPQFSSVSIIGFNAPEWVIGWNGAVFARCIPVGVYSTNNQDVCEFIAKNSGTKMVIAENKELASKFYKLLEQGSIEKIVLYDDEVGENNFGGKLMVWKDFIELGSKVEEGKVEERMAKITPSQCCTLVYTSGTTGMPKGAMISHDNITWNSKGPIDEPEMPGLKTISYLPLSHVAGLLIDIISSVMGGSHVHFAEPTALKGTLMLTVKEVKPNIFFSVPRVWQKIYSTIKQFESGAGGFDGNAIKEAQKYGLAESLKEMMMQPTSEEFKKAKQNVFLKVKAIFGLEESFICAYGGAPLEPEIRRYFMSMNMVLLNGYGLTQTTGPHCGTKLPFFNPKDDQDFLEVGMTKEGCQTIIKKQKETDEDGEICMKGRNVMMGYLNNPEETNKVFDKEGYFHSGDLGKFNEKGYLYLTGRIKEIIVTAGGQNIPPVRIENEIKNALPCISNVMVVGDKKAYLTCLITLLEDSPLIGNLQKNTAAFLQSKGCPAKTISEAKNHPNFEKIIMDGINEANTKAISQANKVQKFHLIQEDFTTDNGTLTASMKLIRPFVLKKFAAEIDQMYGDAQK